MYIDIWDVFISEPGRPADWTLGGARPGGRWGGAHSTHWSLFGLTQITFMSGARSVARHFVSVEMPALDMQ